MCAAERCDRLLEFAGVVEDVEPDGRRNGRWARQKNGLADGGECTLPRAVRLCTLAGGELAAGRRPRLSGRSRWGQQAKPGYEVGD